MNLFFEYGITHTKPNCCNIINLKDYCIPLTEGIREKLFPFTKETLIMLKEKGVNTISTPIYINNEIPKKIIDFRHKCYLYLKGEIDISFFDTEKESIIKICED